jgi:RNA polymerase sigma-70 factor (ECF subfamily)
MRTTLDRTDAPSFPLIPRGRSLGPAGSVDVEGKFARHLALALACAEGDEAAWADFMREYRDFVEGYARRLAARFKWPQTVAEDLVEIAWAELYGLRASGERRASKLASYSGTGSLRGWLRAVLYQIAVDYYRIERSHVPLEEILDHVASPPRQGDLAADSYSEAARGALEQALSGLDSRKKLLLGYYYFDGLTLKQIGRLFGVHEATVSRRLHRAQRDVRKAAERILKRDYKLNGAQIEACVEWGAAGEQVELRGLLATRGELA